MLIKIYVFVFCTMQLVISDKTARILAVFPTPSISHQVVFRPLTQELAKRGHEVIVITTDPVFQKGETPGNLTEIDVHDISYTLWKDFLATATGKPNDLNTQMKVAFGLLAKIFEKQIETEEVQRLIKNNEFDLLLLEACVRPALAFSHVFKVPVIQVSSLGSVLGSNTIIGAPVHPLLYPQFFHTRLYNLTWWEKVTEVYNHYLIENLYDSHEEVENEMVRKNFGPSFPKLSELSNNVQMSFINMHPIWEGNQPVPPSVVYMGGMHQKPEKELPLELKKDLDSSTNGVIYMSFGTNTNPSSLPPEKIQIFVRVFSQLHYDILWKWDKEKLPGKSNNVKISTWFPQSDLLRHSKIKLFITQGGLQSTDEAITAGVPLIGIPMLGDQWYNVEKYVHHKIGLRLNIETLSEERLRDSINTIIGNHSSFKKNIARLRSLMNDQPQKPLERAVWWIEHVLRHGGARHLRAPAANMTWREYLELDLVLSLLLGFLVAISALAFIVCCLIKFVSLNFKPKVE